LRELHGWAGVQNSKTLSAGPALPTNQIYVTAHWVWFADPTIYNQTKNYIDPYLNWPETSYNQIAQWLGLSLPPGQFTGGRRAIYVDSNPGYFAWAAGGNIGIGYQVFSAIPDWPWVVIPHETANMFTGEGVSGGWPSDWWADGQSPFPAMVAVQVEKTFGVSYWVQHDAGDSNNPAYVMFRDKLLAPYGWSLFQKTFAGMIADSVNLNLWHSEYESSSWYSLHYLKSHVVAYYLSRAAGVDLSAVLAQGTVGQQPAGWTNAFYAYRINLTAVIPTVQIQQPSGSGNLSLTANASDPDWAVQAVGFWYSTNNSLFTYIGDGTNNGNAWALGWDAVDSIVGQQQVWVMAISQDMAGFNSSPSVSQPLTVNGNSAVLHVKGLPLNGIQITWSFATAVQLQYTDFDISAPAKSFTVSYLLAPSSVKEFEPFPLA
jgi:hypothetical protein